MLIRFLVIVIICGYVDDGLQILTHTHIFLFQSRLKPGRMLLVDTKEKTMIQDVELKRNIAASRPHSLWLKEQVLTGTLLCFRMLKNGDTYFSNKIICRFFRGAKVCGHSYYVISSSRSLVNCV